MGLGERRASDALGRLYSESSGPGSYGHLWDEAAPPEQFLNATVLKLNLPSLQQAAGGKAPCISNAVTTLLHPLLLVLELSKPATRYGKPK